MAKAKGKSQKAKPAADPEGTPVERRTVRGKPIPTHLEHAIPHRLTDEGIRERNATGKKSSVRVSVRDRFERQIEAREAAAKDLIEPWSAPDPLQEAVDRVADKRPDMTYRALSDNVVKRRGMRGFEVCKDKDGREIKVASMTLARMPKKLAKRRNDHYRELGNAALREAEATLEEQHEKVIRDGKAVGLSTLHRTDVLRDVTNREHVVPVGLRASRGNRREVEE
jgi:hypothetical protein